MTTSVKIKSANYPVLVTSIDLVAVRRILADKPVNVKESQGHSRVLWPEDGEVQFYATTSRCISAIDLEYDDPRAAEDRAARFPAPTKEDGA